MNSHLKIALRNLYREKTYALINVAGLALAVVCCLIVTLYLRNELTYDRHHLNHERIFRVVNEFSINAEAQTNRFATTSRALGPMLKDAYPEIQEYVQFIPQANNNKTMLRYGDKALYWDKGLIATDNVFKVFTHKVLYGDPDTALVDPNSIAVSETFARAYFGDENPIGKTLLADSGVSRKISLVFADLPDNSHLKYDLLFSINQEFFRLPEDISQRRRRLTGIGDYTYLLMPEGYQASDYLRINDDFYERNLAEIGRQANMSWRSWLQPLADIHLYSDVGYDEPTGNRFYLFGFAAVGIFILLVACINYINIATARATRRAKTVGLRKILGASRASLMLQFLGEAIMFTLIAAVLGLLLAEVILTLSPLNSLIGKQLSLNLSQEPSLLLWVLSISLLTGLIAGLYPAFYLSSWAPVSAMVGRNRQGKGSVRFRQSLVFLQFTISIAVISVTLLMSAQMRFVAEQPLGFAKENRLMVTLRGANLVERAPTIIKDLSATPGILGITLAERRMGENFPINVMQVANNQDVMQPIGVTHGQVGDNYLQVMGLQLLAGRDFSQKLLTDLGSSYIVNESFVRQMGWQEPIGKRINDGRVIGVVADFNFKSLHTPVEPFAFRAYQDDFSNLNEFQRRLTQRLMILNISGENVAQTLRVIEEKFAEFDPEHPFEFSFIDDSLNQLYTSEQSMMTLIGIFAGICILIACMGLFGLAVFTTEQRTKEIGVRKTLGASTGQIILLLARNILLLVVAGAALAAVISYLAIDEWLTAFAYRAPINPMVFLIATLAAALVAYITIALQSYRTASADPVGTLRYE